MSPRKFELSNAPTEVVEKVEKFNTCWYHQLGTVYTVKWAAFVLPKQNINWFK